MELPPPPSLRLQADVSDPMAPLSNFMFTVYTSGMSNPSTSPSVRCA